MLTGKEIGFLGAGNMAEALVRGLLQSHLVNERSLWISDARPERLQYFQERYSLPHFEENRSLAAHCHILILAIKPQQMREVLHEIRETVRSDQILISIAAGIPTSLIIEELKREARVVRVMPNTPALVLE